jgi:hypothetical protein
MSRLHPRIEPLGEEYWKQMLWSEEDWEEDSQKL